ncbi:MAG: hypothetical protein ACRDHP_17385 [Ktedonobacterales bacterium]
MAHLTSARRRAPAAPLPALAARMRSLSFAARAVIVISVVAAIVRLLSLGGASTDYDEGVYWQSLRALAHGHPLFT